MQDLLGTPIMGYGETTKRGRRQYVAHELYQRNGVPYMRMQFYVHGSRNKATVHLDIRQVRILLGTSSSIDVEMEMETFLCVVNFILLLFVF